MRTKKVKRLEGTIEIAQAAMEKLAQRNWELYEENKQLLADLEEAWDDIIKLANQNQALTKKLNYVFDILERSVPALEAAAAKQQPAKGPDRANRPKLTEREVKDIRAAHQGGMKQKDLADNYGVNRSTIYRIVKGVYYK